MWVGPSQQAGNTYSGNWMSIKFLGTYPSWLPSSALNHSSWLLKIYVEEMEDKDTVRTLRSKRWGFRAKNALLDPEENSNRTAALAGELQGHLWSLAALDPTLFLHKNPPRM